MDHDAGINAGKSEADSSGLHTFGVFSGALPLKRRHHVTNHTAYPGSEEMPEFGT